MEFQERRVAVEKLTAHVWEAGDGYPVLMMHGAGPGTSAAVNFAKVREPLAESYKVYGTDMIGFGQSDRKKEAPFFDYDLWLAQMQAVLDSIPEGPVGLLGHSISATFALRLAGRNPRVDKVLLSCPMGTPLKPNRFREQLWTYPKTKDDLRASLQVLFYDHSVITDELLETRMAVLGEGNYGAYFEAMFGGDKQALVNPTVLSEAEVTAVECPVCIVHGREDYAFPFEETGQVLADLLPQADVHVLSACSHGPAFERPDLFLAIAKNFYS